MDIGEKLRTARGKTGLTQEQVAEEIKVSRQTISNWENGKSLPDIVSVLHMSELYQVSLDALLKGDQVMMDKIEKDTSVVKSGRRLVIIGSMFVLLAVVLRLADIFLDGPFLEFSTAAMPWVLMGVGVACALAYLGRRQPR